MRKASDGIAEPKKCYNRSYSTNSSDSSMSSSGVVGLDDIKLQAASLHE